MISAFDQFQSKGDAAKVDLGSAKHLAFACCTYLTVFLILFSPVLFTGQLMAPDDGFVQNLPNFFGRRTLWSLSIYSGFPLLADPLVQYFYPLPLLLCHLPQGWNIFVLCGYVLSGTFLYLYLRMLTGSPFASFAGGLFYCLSGYLLCETLHVHVVQAAMWFAALLVILEYLARQREAESESKAFVLGALVVCFCTLNGQPQLLSYMLGVAALYAPLRAMSQAGRRDKLKYIAICYAILAIGVTMAALQILPTAELAAFSARTRFAFQDFLTYDMHPLESFGVFLPFLFGGAPDGIIGQPYYASFICPPHFLYLGYIPLFLSLALVSAFARNRLVIFWALAGLLTFFLSFGDFTPLAWILYHLPPFGSFRCLHRILLVTALANSILAGLGVAALEKGILSRKSLVVSSACVVLTFLAILATVSTLKVVLAGQAIKYGIKDLGVLPWNNPALGCSTIFFLLSLLALAFFARGPRKKGSKCLLAAIAVIDLTFLGWYAQGGQWRLRSSPLDKIAAPATAQKYVPLANLNYNRILSVRGGSSTLDQMPNNLCRLWDVPSASGYEPLMLSRYGSLLNMSEGGFLFPSWQYTARDRCFDILSIKYATTDRADDRLEKLVDQRGVSPWHKVETIGTATIHENQRLLPRCWMVHQVQTLSAPEIMQAIKTSTLPGGKTFDPATTALTEEAINFNSFGDPERGGWAVKIAVLTDDYIKVEVITDDAAVLVLSDIYYPWWTATIDGQASAIFRVDYLLRGLVVSAGRHTVEFKLHADSLDKGLALSAIGALLLALGYFALRRKRSAQAQSAEAEVGKGL